jgi:hypothetical protein
MCWLSLLFSYINFGSRKYTSESTTGMTLENFMNAYLSFTDTAAVYANFAAFFAMCFTLCLSLLCCFSSWKLKSGNAIDLLVDDAAS